jgi:hypothetical protein
MVLVFNHYQLAYLANFEVIHCLDLEFSFQLSLKVLYKSKTSLLPSYWAGFDGY